MADVKILNGYDIKDAKALRNKSTTAVGSFVDTKAGTTPYPTTGSNLTGSTIIGGASYVSANADLSGITIYGSGANVNSSFATAVGSSSNATLYSAAFGAASKASASYTMAAGYNAKATAQYAVAVGPSSNASQNYTTALGSSASAIGPYSISVGYNARALASSGYSTVIGSLSNANGSNIVAIGYGATSSSSDSVAIGHNVVLSSSSVKSVVIGQGARVAAYSSYSTVIGAGAKNDTYNSYSVVIGYNAEVKQQYSAQIGTGTNVHYGALQFRDWLLVDHNGKIPEERLPNGIKSATAQFPNLYDIDEEKVSEQAILYTGATNDSYTNSQFYRGRVRYGYPRFNCGWVDSDWLDSQNDMTIDQQKLFTKLAEITKQRIDNNDVENGLIGGDNAEQTIYLYYDANNDYYFIRFDSDSFEKVFNGTPDDITGLSFDDFADYGIYFRNFHKPSDLEGEYEFCDIYYYAPAYIDNYDWNDSPSYVNYLQFLYAMCDSDWGAGYVIPDIDTWEFVVDGTTYYCPVIPNSYEWNGDEHDGVEVRWEWNSPDWTQYINGEDIGRSWSTEEMYTTFGIKIEPGEESNVGHISFYVRGGDQRYWEQFDPVDSANFCTKQEKQDMQSDINRLKNNSFKLIQNARNLNDITNSGTYHIQALGCTNLPSTASASRDMFLFVTRTDANNVKQVLITDYVNKSSGGMNYGTYCSNMYVRTLSGGTWRSWEVILTPDDLMFLPGFDKTKKQVIGHTANLNNITWQESSGGDIDCGTM